MTIALGREPRPGGATLPGWGWHAAAALAVASVGCASVWLALHASPTQQVHTCALFVHLASLVVGFGAVLAVDWAAALWLFARREFEHVLDTAATVAVPIWIGYAGLVASGLLLEPNLADPLTKLKVVLVVVIGVNGVLATWLHAAMKQSDSPRLLVVGSMSAGASQAAWWGATVIGFLNAQ